MPVYGRREPARWGGVFMRTRTAILWLPACVGFALHAGGESVGSPSGHVGHGSCSAPEASADPLQAKKGVQERVRERVKQAQDLARADRRKEGIALLTESLPELAMAEWAGLRAYQLAHLARIYMEDGERDWAVTLLERIREDPELDEGQFLLAEAVAEGRVLKQEGSGHLRTQKKTTCLSIKSEACFEVRVDWQEFGGRFRPVGNGRIFTHWFSLAEDPFKTTNLSKGDDTVFPGTGVEGGVLEILEDTPVRCRLRWSADDESGRFAEYTIYPTGQVYGLRGEPGPEDRAGKEGGPAPPALVAFHRRLHPRPEPEEEVSVFVRDYLDPARVRVRQGGIVRGDAGDLDGDGFNESEGCYVVRGARRVIVEAGERERVQPVIKFRRPPVTGLPDVIANGSVAGRPKYNLAWVDSGVLLLHWRGNIPSGGQLEVVLR